MPGSVNCIFNDHALWQTTSVTAQVPQRGTVYIWHGNTGNLLQQYNYYYRLLTAAEQARAQRYLHENDRQQYVIRHGLLRVLLGWYLNMPAFNEAFIYGPNKKPYLPQHNAQPCFFNLSHSAGEFLIAIGDKELGVDIEYLKPGFNHGDIAAQYFGADEQTYIINADEATEAFFLLWTRKEALLKATGKGIDDDLPLIPALNGEHALPPNYDDTNWLCTSCMTGGNSIMSVVYPLPGDIAISLHRL